MSFIPAKESRFLIWFFDLYTRIILRIRFKDIWIKQDYKPIKGARTVYFVNHNMWWDGLLPLYLSRNIFGQRARAIMEDTQMIKHRFFSKIGAFSIDLSDHRSTITSLRYAVESTNRPNSGLYIYPEGELTPVSNSRPDFKQGLAWIYQNIEAGVDLVPIAFDSNNFRHSKPELYINIGRPITIDKRSNKSELTSVFEKEIQMLLNETRSVAGLTDHGFVKQ